MKYYSRSAKEKTKIKDNWEAMAVIYVAIKCSSVCTAVEIEKRASSIYKTGLDLQPSSIQEKKKW